MNFLESSSKRLKCPVVYLPLINLLNTFDSDTYICGLSLRLELNYAPTANERRRPISCLVITERQRSTLSLCVKTMPSLSLLSFSFTHTSSRNHIAFESYTTHAGFGLWIIETRSGKLFEFESKSFEPACFVFSQSSIEASTSPHQSSVIIIVVLKMKRNETKRKRKR